MKLEKNRCWLEIYRKMYDLYEELLASGNKKYKDCYIYLDFYSIYQEESSELIDMDDYNTFHRKLTLSEQINNRYPVANGISLYLKNKNKVIEMCEKFELPLSDNKVYYHYMTYALIYFLEHQKRIEIAGNSIHGDNGNKCSFDFVGKIDDKIDVNYLVSLINNGFTFYDNITEDGMICEREKVKKII